MWIVTEGDVSYAPEEEGPKVLWAPDWFSCQPNMTHQTSHQKKKTPRNEKKKFVISSPWKIEMTVYAPEIC